MEAKANKKQIEGKERGRRTKEGIGVGSRARNIRSNDMGSDMNQPKNQPLNRRENRRQNQARKSCQL